MVLCVYKVILSRLGWLAPVDAISRFKTGSGTCSSTIIGEHQVNPLLGEVTRREQQHDLHVDTARRSATRSIHAASNTRHGATSDVEIDKENKVDKRKVMMESPRERRKSKVVQTL